MIVLAGADIVLPDRIVPRGSLLLDGGTIVAIDTRERIDPAGASIIDCSEHYIVPGFVDVHVHGLEGHDTLDPGATRLIARKLPRYGVTAFCPTSVACPPGDLAQMLADVRDARVAPSSDAARVLPAHLESNFINPEYRGAQPAACLRTPDGGAPEGEFGARDILDVIERARPDVGIVTLAPELPGALDLIATLAARGHLVSLGHSAASFDEAIAGIEAGARHATHLFNRMTPLTHRAPGLTGAVLAREDISAELICDGYHVHPAMCRVAIAAKGAGGVLAITDGTGGSGLPVGATARLGGRRITVGERAATLDDGTLAGSTLTMDAAFRTIVSEIGLSIVDAAVLCSTSPARQMGLVGYGVVADRATADLVVLDRSLRVARTFIDGQQVFAEK